MEPSPGNWPSSTWRLVASRASWARHCAFFYGFAPRVATENGAAAEPAPRTRRLTGTRIDSAAPSPLASCAPVARTGRHQCAGGGGSRGRPLDAVVSLDLKRDNRPVDMNHPGTASDCEALRRGCEMLDFNESAHAPFSLGQARADGVAGGVLEMGNEPRSREHAGIRSSANEIRLLVSTVMTCSPAVPVFGGCFIGTGPLARPGCPPSA